MPSIKRPQATIISDNPKMDTSGMAGKPIPMDDFGIERKPPVMKFEDIRSRAPQMQPKRTPPSED